MRVPSENGVVLFWGIIVDPWHRPSEGAINISFDLSFPDTPEGNQARKLVDNLIRISHEKDCTVSRTVENPTRVLFSNDSK